VFFVIIRCREFPTRGNALQRFSTFTGQLETANNAHHELHCAKLAAATAEIMTEINLSDFTDFPDFPDFPD